MPPAMALTERSAASLHNEPMPRLTARLIGYPRIGPARELKWALERAWSGRTTSTEFIARVAELRDAHLDEQRRLVGSAVDDYFVYDEVLETVLQLGLVPDDLRDLLADDPFEALTVLARGSEEREAWEMTKWFDTNYHYVVPEISGPPRPLVPLPWREPVAGAAWAILGPVQHRQAEQAVRWTGANRSGRRHRP